MQSQHTAYYHRACVQNPVPRSSEPQNLELQSLLPGTQEPHNTVWYGRARHPRAYYCRFLHIRSWCLDPHIPQPGTTEPGIANPQNLVWESLVLLSLRPQSQAVQIAILNPFSWSLIPKCGTNLIPSYIDQHVLYPRAYMPWVWCHRLAYPRAWYTRAQDRGLLPHMHLYSLTPRPGTSRVLCPQSVVP